MKKTISILSAFAILLCLWLAALWLPALTDEGKPQSETRYGVSEGLELVEQTFAGKERNMSLRTTETWCLQCPCVAASSIPAIAAAGSVSEKRAPDAKGISTARAS